MGDGSVSGEGATAAALVAYIEDLLLELAEAASIAGETALAASLAIAAVQAGSRRRALAA